MRHLPPSILLLMASLPSEAGYSEYQDLAPTVSESLWISSDSGAPDVNSPQASADYKAYIASKGQERSWFWALYTAPEASERWADCRETGEEVACTIVGPFRYSGFTCPLGESEPWTRTCTTRGGKAGELKIYSVDTREYEEGGSPVVNHYLAADQKRFNARCNQQPVR